MFDGIICLKSIIILAYFNLISKILTQNTFNTKNVSSSGSILLLEEMVVDCTQNNKIGALVSFKYIDDGSTAYISYNCSFLPEIYQDPNMLVKLETNYDTFNHQDPSNSINFLNKHILDCSGTSSSVINYFVLNYDNQKDEINFSYKCVKVNQLNPQNVTLSTLAYVNSQCSYTSEDFNFFYFPNDNNINNGKLLTKFFLENTDSPNCTSRYIYTYKFVCNIACSGCNTMIPALNCISCAQHYYAKSDALNNCYNTTPQNYFMNKSNMLYTPCYIGCLTCSGLGDINNMNCLSCNNNYYPLVDNNSNCFVSAPIGYFLDLSKNLFSKCYSSCSTCSGLGDIKDMKCLSCNNNFYPIRGQGSNCYSQSTVPNNYILLNNQFEICYLSCSSCSAIGNSSHNFCKTCAPNYYPKYGGISNCYNNKTISSQNYILKNESYYMCYNSCATCSDIGTLTNQNCLSCANGFYPLAQLKSQCYSTTNAPTNSILINDSFNMCYMSCATCDKMGSSNSHNCVTCANKYYPLSNNNTLCFNADPVGYYFDTTNNTYNKCFINCGKCSSSGVNETQNCLSCKLGFDLINSNCYSSCKDGYERTGTICKSCSQLNKYYYNSICVSVCPSLLFPNQNGSCIKCNNQNIYKNICYDKCPKVIFNNTCVDECPNGYYLINFNCSFNNSINSSIFFLIKVILLIMMIT